MSRPVVNLPIGCLLLLAAVLAGCASLPALQPPGEDFDHLKERRETDAVRRFEQQRLFAELNAASSCWDRDDMKGCEEIVRRILARNPGQRDAQLLYAEVCLAAGRYEQAAEMLRQVLASDPNSASTQHTLGLVLDAMGRHDSAVEHYSRAVELEPNVELYALSYKQSQEPASPAVEQRQSLPERPPVTLPSQAPVAVVEDAIRQPESLHDLVGALPEDSSAGPAIPTQSHSQQPDVATSATNASTDEIPTDEIPADEIPANGAAPAQRPSPPDLLPELLKEIPVVTDNRIEPVARLEQAGRDEPNEDPFRPAIEALDAGNHELALIRFRARIDACPDNPEVPIEAAVQSLRHNAPHLAVAILTPAARRFPDSARIHQTLGVAGYRSGEYASSQVSLQQALSLDKDNALTYLLMGCTLRKVGEAEAAEEHFRRAVALNPALARRR